MVLAVEGEGGDGVVTEQFLWREEYSAGDVSLDEQHRFLLDLADHLFQEDMKFVAFVRENQHI